MAEKPQPGSQNSDELALLDQLMQSPPPRRARSGQRAVLQSATQVRRQALAGYRLRNWVDGLLAHTERLFLIAAVAVFAFWFFDRFGRDLIYAYTQEQAQPAENGAMVELQPAGEGLEAVVSLPFTTPDMERGNADAEFLVPGQVFEPVAPPDDQRPQYLSIAAIELETPITEVFIENGAWQVADYAAGYHSGTAFPGEGNTVLAGHAGLRGAVFRRLGDLQVGDQISLDTGGWRFVYTVRERQSVWPHQVEVMAPTPEPILTLITCTNFDTQRLVVVADLVSAYPLQR